LAPQEGHLGSKKGWLGATTTSSSMSFTTALPSFGPSHTALTAGSRYENVLGSSSHTPKPVVEEEEVEEEEEEEEEERLFFFFFSFQG